MILRQVTSGLADKTYFAPGTKAEMPCKNNLQRPKLQHRGRKILFHFITGPALLLYSIYEQAAVLYRNIERLHEDAKLADFIFIKIDGEPVALNFKHKEGTKAITRDAKLIFHSEWKDLANEGDVTLFSFSTISAGRRPSVYCWFKSPLRSRLKPGAGCVTCHARVVGKNTNNGGICIAPVAPAFRPTVYTHLFLPYFIL